MSTKAQTKTEWPGAFETFEQAFRAIPRNLRPLLYYLGVLLACQIVIIAVTGKLPAGGYHIHSRGQDGAGVLISLVSLVLLPYLARYELSLAKGKAVRASELLKPDFRLYVDLILALILGGLVMIGGALPLLIPLIWVIPAVSLLIFVVVDQDMGPWIALKESFRLSQDNKSKIWGMLGVSLLLAVVGSIVNIIPVVGLLASAAIGVVSQVALARLYFWLRARAPKS